MAHRRFAPAVAAALAFGSIALLPSPALAQSDRPSWGVTFSYVPEWKPLSDLAPLFFGVEEMDAKGSEFRIGAVRGRQNGGDWSVTFVRTKFKTGSVFDDTETADSVPGIFGESYVTHDDVVITGVRYEKFVPFLNIKNRAQIGMTFGAGVGKISGTVDRHVFDPVYGFLPSGGAPILIRQDETVDTIDVEDFLDRTTVPLGNVEFAAAFMVAPGLKVRATGGFNFPNTQVFQLTVNYLFGR